jgi:hypothetical protein
MANGPDLKRSGPPRNSRIELQLSPDKIDK